MEATTPSKRFGWALVSSTVLVATIGFVLYLQSPSNSLKPVVLTHASSFAEKASGAETVNPGVHRMVEHFVGSLERRDVDGMRIDFPTMTRREARLLRSIRARLGYDAQLTLTDEHLKRTGDRSAVLDFVIAARQPNARGELRLPFHADLRLRNGTWLIAELH